MIPQSWKINILLFVGFPGLLLVEDGGGWLVLSWVWDCVVGCLNAFCFGCVGWFGSGCWGIPGLMDGWMEGGLG